MIMTISGMPGSGKSSVADFIAKKLNMKRYSAGDFRREIAIKNNLNIIFSIWTIILLIVSFDVHFEYIFKYNVLGFTSVDQDRIASFLRKELKIGHFVLGFCFICSGFIFEKYNHKPNTYIAVSFLITIFFL